MLIPNRTVAALFAVMIGLAFLGLSGCEQITGAGRVEINGEITMDNNPLNDVMVAFVPMQYRNNSGKLKSIGFGQSDDAGRFTLRTKQTKGIEPGVYRVLIYNGEDAKGNEADRGFDPQGDLLPNFIQDAGVSNDPAEAATPDATADVLGAESALNARIPSEYNFQTELRFTVVAGAGILYPKFELKSHGRN